MPIMAAKQTDMTRRVRRSTPIRRKSAARQSDARRSPAAHACGIVLLASGLAIAALTSLEVHAAPAKTATAQRPRPTARQIAWWVRCLGDRSYQVREAASKALTDVGPPAKYELLKALSDPDAEIRRRARLILADVLELDFEARLEAFAADTQGLGHHELPGWERYRAIVGEDATARWLFVEMQRAERDLLEAADAGPEFAAKAIEERCEQIQKGTWVQGRPVPRHPSAGSVAALLFVAADKAVPLSKQLVPRISEYCSLQPAQRAANGKDKAPLRKLLGAWVTRSAGADPIVSYPSLMLAMQYDLPEGVEPALAMLKDANVPAHTRQYLILVVGKLGTPRNVAALSPLLKDARVCSQQRFNNNTHVNTQVRDVALAVLLKLTGQNLKDYGFRRAQESPLTLFNVPSLGFATEPERAAALKKWDDWVAAKRIELKNKAARQASSPTKQGVRSQ